MRISPVSPILNQSKNVIKKQVIKMIKPSQLIQLIMNGTFLQIVSILSINLIFL